MIGLMRMKFKMMILFIAFGMAVGVAAPAQAVTNVGGSVDGPWLEFLFGGPGTFAVDCAGSCTPSSGGNAIDAGAPPWGVLARPEALTLTVTDAFIAVDQFKIYDFGSLIGTTSVPSGSNPGLSDPVLALADPNYSHGVFNLAAGVPHGITIQQIAGQSGAGYFRLATVPEPSTLLLLGSGLAGLGLWGRRRFKASS